MVRKMLEFVIIVIALSIYFPLAIYIAFVRPKKKRLKELEKIEAQKKRRKSYERIK